MRPRHTAAVVALLILAILVPVSVRANHQTPRASPEKVHGPPTVVLGSSTVPASPSTPPSPQEVADFSGRASRVLRLSSTAYCLTGRMANGQRTYVGAAASNLFPLGTRLRVLSGPLAGQTLVISDRVGRGSQLDVAFPGACGRARSYGRRTVSVQVG